MTDAYWQLNRFDIETRIADEGRPDLRTLVAAHEFDQAGTVMQNDDVTVSAARVFHPPIAQSYAYRFNAKDRSIVVSGDTGYSQELITLATGADVLVHEVMHLGGVESLLKRVPNAATLRVNLLRHHTSTEDVGRVAAQRRDNAFDRRFDIRRRALFARIGIKQKQPLAGFDLARFGKLHADDPGLAPGDAAPA